MGPNLRIDRFDGGGHFDGDAAMVVGLVAVTVDDLFEPESEMPGWELAVEEIWGPESARTHTLTTRCASHQLGRRQTTDSRHRVAVAYNHLASLDYRYGGANVFNSLLPMLRRTALPQVLARTRLQSGPEPRFRYP